MDIVFPLFPVVRVPVARAALFRRFRDRVMADSPAGRRLISWYYQNGPALAMWVVEHPQLRKPMRPVFDWGASYLDSGIIEGSRWQRAFVDVGLMTADHALDAAAVARAAAAAIREAKPPAAHSAASDSNKE